MHRFPQQRVHVGNFGLTALVVAVGGLVLIGLVGADAGLRVEAASKPEILRATGALNAAKKVKGKVRQTSTTVARATSTTLPPPKTFNVATDRMTEVSGCAVAKGDANTVWLHNDSDNEPQLFGLNLTTKAVRTVNVTNALNNDWEDLAPLPSGGLLIGDIGSNDHSRSAVELYEVNDLTQSSATAVQRKYTYEDGPHNAEALLVDPESAVDNPAVYVITKEETGQSGVYRTDRTALRKIGAVTITGEALIYPNQITGAAALPGASGVLLRTYQYAYLFRRPKGQPFEASFGASPIRIALPFLIQSEAVCVEPDGRTAITTTESRGSPTISFVLFAIPK